MKNSSPDTSVPDAMPSSYSNEENSWPMRFGWLAVILLLGVIISAAIYFSLPDSQEPQGIHYNLPLAMATSLEQGTLLVEQGQLDSAETLYVQLIKDYPKQPQGYNNLAALHALRGDLDQAKTLLEQAMATNVEYTAIYRNLGTIYAELARDSYGRALLLEPADLRTQLQILDPQGTALLVAAEEQPVETDPVVTQVSPVVPDVTTTAQEEVVVPVAEPAEPVVETEPAVTAVTEIEEPTVPVVVATPVEEVVQEEATPVQPETPQGFIESWAAAWSAQDADSYFSFYAEDYLPRSHKTRAGWLKKRKSRIIRPAFIEVTIDKFKILSSSDQQVEIELVQSYRNDRFQDKTRKRFELARLDDGFLITRERSMGSAN